MICLCARPRSPLAPAEDLAGSVALRTGRFKAPAVMCTQEPLVAHPPFKSARAAARTRLDPHEVVRRKRIHAAQIRLA